MVRYRRRVHLRNVTRGDGVDRRARREHRHLTTSRSRLRPGIAAERPRPQRARPEQQRRSSFRVLDAHAVRKIADVAAIRARAAVGAQSIAMELEVDARDGGRRSEAMLGVARSPRLFEALEVGAATFSARPVPGRQRRRLIQKEQLRVAAGPHHRPASALEVEHARHPRAVASDHAPHEATPLVVQAPAVAHQRSAGGGGDDVSSRRDAVLERHLARMLLFAAPGGRPPRSPGGRRLPHTCYSSAPDTMTAHLKIADLNRLHEIIRAFTIAGFGEIFKQMGLEDAAERTGRFMGWKDAADIAHLDRPRRVCLIFERLGPTFMKLGQILATRPDLFGPDWIAEFEKLQYQAPVLDFKELRPQIEADLGAPLEELFEEVDPRPLAAASIAQVHRATLKDGTRVVLKIQR